MEDATRREIGESEEFCTSFLLKEYETLRILRQDYIALGDSRFNFFLLILSGAAFFITWINSKEPANLSHEVVSLVTVAIGVGVLLLGLTTFVRIARRNSSIVLYSRGMARIRHYFVEHYPEIEKLIITPLYDDKPEFRPVSTSEQLPIMLGIINGLVAGTSLSLFISETSLIAGIAIGVAAFVGVFWAQLKYYELHMQKRSAPLPVYFPSGGDH